MKQLKIDALIFSRDRAPQLDLLLRSIYLNAPTLFDAVKVIWTASEPRYLRGYDQCASDHLEIEFHRERDFSEQVKIHITYARDLVCTFTDDDIIYRSIEGEGITRPDHLLYWENEVFCFNLRLGLNTTYCYPLEEEQHIPTIIGPQLDDLIQWDWRDGHLDFGYPSSLDGTLYRAEQLKWLLYNQQFSNPNEMEDVMVRSAVYRDDTPPLAGAYRHSAVVNTPVNLVNETHSNRHGDYHRVDQGQLNDEYLFGKRLSLDMDFSSVNAAHVELPLRLS